MYVVFEQRERGLQGSSFVESAWDRFYRDLATILAPAEAFTLPAGAGNAEDYDENDFDEDDAAESGAA